MKRRNGGYKPTVRFELSERVIEEIDNPCALATYIRAVTVVARRGVFEISGLSLRRHRKGIGKLLEMGLVEPSAGGYMVSAFVRDGMFQLFWLKDSKPKPKGTGMRARFSVLRRDGFRCVYCGATPPESELHVDHVEPRSGGGSNDLVNLVTACRDCNLGKGAQRLAEPLQ